MKSEPLRLGDRRYWGETTCQFGLTAPKCVTPATRHFMWLTDNSASAACDVHAAYIHSRDTSEIPFDEHAHGPDCGMPGALWKLTDGDTEGYCYFGFVVDAESVAKEPEPVSAVCGR